MNTRAILIVEDNPKDEMLALRVIKKSGLPIQAIVVRDGAEALDYLISDGRSSGGAERELPAAVFLDLKLPKLNGLDVLREIRKHERTRHLPVIILTSSDDEGDILSVYQSGANSYVRKPVAYEDFDSTLVKLSEYWGVLNETPCPGGKAPGVSG